jgi:tetratricopeptide (TPR) repeat protein
MVGLLIASGLILLSGITIGDIISLAVLAKSLIGWIGEKDAFDILKVALDKTIKQSEDAEAKEILKKLKKNEQNLSDLRKLDVSGESKKSCVSQYFNGREDVFEDLAKNYFELFSEKATKKNGTFKQFVVFELEKIANHCVLTIEEVKSIKRLITEITEETTEIRKIMVPFINQTVNEQRELLRKIKISWLRQFLTPFENALNLQNSRDYSKSIELYLEILEEIKSQRQLHIGDENYIICEEVNSIETVCFFNLGVNLQYLKKHLKAIEFYGKSIFLAERLGFASNFIAVNYNNRGVAYAGSNQHENAIENYNRAIELNRDCAEAYYNRGVTYYDLNQPERTIKDFNVGIELNQNYAEAYWNRGIAYQKIGKYKEAAQDLKKSGILLWESGREGDAIKVFSFCSGLRGVKSNDADYCYLALFLLRKPPEVISIASDPRFLEAIGRAYGLTESERQELIPLLPKQPQFPQRLLRYLKLYADSQVIEELQMQIQDETLRNILELSLSKLRNEDVSEKITSIKRGEEREDIRILLELLDRL